jgi:hypothetical protein
MLPFAIFFFLAIFEIYPIYREKIIPERIAFFFVGLSIAAVMQLHMSWVLMIPMALAGFFFQYRRDRGRLFAVAAYCLLGALIGFSTLIPTFIVHGIGGTGGVERNVVINSAHLADIVLILPRFLFFAAFQIHYMIPGGSWADLMRDHRWLLPFAALLEGVGWMQVAFFFICLFLPDRSPEWNRTRWFTILAVAMIHVSFLFSIKEPSSHTMYLMFPLALFYSCHCYRRLMFGHIWRRRIIAGILVVGIIFHVGLAIDNYENRSLYKRRDLVENALTQKDYKLLGLRRADEWGHGY